MPTGARWLLGGGGKKRALLAVREAASTAEAIRLHQREAPRLEIERQKKQEEDSRAAQEKARLVNKATFRP